MEQPTFSQLMKFSVSHARNVGNYLSFQFLSTVVWLLHYHGKLFKSLLRTFIPNYESI